MRKTKMIFILTAVLVLLSACGETGSNQAAQEQKIKTKMITHMKGETEIPVNPQRLIDLSGSAEELDILGIPYIACAQTSMFDGITVPPI